MIKLASEILRIKGNIQRLETLKSRIHDLSYFVTASQSGAFHLLTDLLDQKLVRGRERILHILEKAVHGENNQKLALDSPTKFAQLMRDAEKIVDMEITKEHKELKEIEAH